MVLQNPFIKHFERNGMSKDPKRRWVPRRTLNALQDLGDTNLRVVSNALCLFRVFNRKMIGPKSRTGWIRNGLVTGKVGGTEIKQGCSRGCETK